MQEKESWLTVLIENTLTTGIKATREINGKRNDKDEQKMIIDFINHLPEHLKDLPNRDELIINVLEEQGISTMWTEKKKQEHKFEKKAEKPESKSKIKTVEKEEDELDSK